MSDEHDDMELSIEQQKQIKNFEIRIENELERMAEHIRASRARRIAIERLKKFRDAGVHALKTRFKYE